MASFWLLSAATIIALISCNFSLSLASYQHKIHVSTISAAPTVLPYASAPTLSPDIEPLFPTPAAYTPSESSLPTIPSSPSPPNPDSFGSVLAFPPSGSMVPAAAPTSHASSQNKLCSILHLALAGFCIMIQFHGM